MLHAINAKNWDKKTAWCVPTAISFISGIPLAHSHSRAAYIKGIAIDDVEGVDAKDALLMLHEQGYISKQISLKDRYDDAPKLLKFLDDRTAYERCMPLYIVIEKPGTTFTHAIAAHFDYLADSWTMKPTHKDKFPNNDAVVTGAFVVEKRNK